LDKPTQNKALWIKAVLNKALCNLLHCYSCCKACIKRQ